MLKLLSPLHRLLRLNKKWGHQIQSAMLEGAPQGEARQIWWDEKLAFQFDEDDEDDEEEGGGGREKASGTAASASAPPPVPGTPLQPPLPPPAASAATTISQREKGAETGDAFTTSPAPASGVEGMD